MKNDILFFKVFEREYSRSMEINNIVLDLDKENFIVGIQILEASEFLNTSKSNLLKVPKWAFQASINEGEIEVRLEFQILVRNKLIEKNPIIMQPTMGYLPNSTLTCEMGSSF